MVVDPAEEFDDPDAVDLDDDFDDDALDTADDTADPLTKIIGQLDLDTAWEEPPATVRNTTGIKYAEVPWETVLANVREHAGQSMKLWSFDHPTAKATARSRAKAIRGRLFTARPNERWTVVARESAPNVWGVYSRFEEYLDDEAVAERLAVYTSQKERLEMARLAKEG